MTGIKTVKGIIRGGRVELSEKLDTADGTEVTVNVPVEQSPANPRQITFGMFAKPGGRETTWEDFVEAKKSWESKDPS
jgi:hypothetical protein